MDEKSASLDELFEKDRNWISDELNGQEYYFNLVKRLGFREIGIIILNEQKEEIRRYATRNGIDGKIKAIVDYFQNPDLVVSVRERTLLEIIRNREEIKTHPVASFIKYQSSFTMKIGEYLKLAKAVISF